MFEKKSLQEAAGHNSGPQNKHTMVDQGWKIVWMLLIITDGS